ncbi:hypothetical protein [Paenibacillus dendritiformis]|uniref:hypothetical protein n=1 Tax=Paenibacillus dendritiformis TaxID=130049 RepID=UPI00387E0FA6
MKEYLSSREICPLCKTKLKVDEIESTEELARIFVDVLSKYDELARLNIDLQSNSPLMDNLDHEERIKSIKARFQNALEKLLISSTTEKHLVSIEKEVFKELIQFIEKDKDVEEENGAGYLAAQNQVRAILSKIGGSAKWN